MEEDEGKLLKTIILCAEICGTELSKPAAIFIESELRKLPENIALKALVRVAREHKGKFSLAEILSRVDDGRPSADEAWSLVPRDEQVTIVWNDEIAEAWDCCRDLLTHDQVAARMTFKAAYERIIRERREAGRSPSWFPSLGFDPGGRIEPIRKAVALGRLSEQQARALLPANIERGPANNNLAVAVRSS